MKNRHEAVIHHPKPEDVLSDLRELVVEAEKIVGSSVENHTEDAMNSLRERFASAQERLSAVYTGARKKVVAGAKATDTAIRENPYQSLAIAAGVGLLLGVLLGRRSAK